MGFWSNVEAEREYQGMSRKELALRANISYAGIGLGLERDSMPGADTALRISKVLQVSIEYLLSDNVQESKKEEKTNDFSSELNLFRQYRNLIDDIETISPHIKEAICDMIHHIAAKEKNILNSDFVNYKK